MAQIVGSPCAVCGEKISFASDAVACPDCFSHVHHGCVKSGIQGACHKCGAPDALQAVADQTGRVPTKSPEPYDPIIPATPEEVRRFGLLMFAFGTLFAFFFDGWETKRGVPASFIGLTVAVVGLWTALFPNRESVRRRMGRPRPPPLPAQPGASAYAGQFERIRFAVNLAPYPMRGPGHLTMGPHGMDLTGTQFKTSRRDRWIRVTAVFMGLGTLLGLVELEAAWWLALLGLVGFALTVFFVRPKAGDPVAHFVSWSAIEKMQEKDGSVELHVRGAEPRGVVLFRPDGPLEPFLAELRKRTGA